MLWIINQEQWILAKYSDFKNNMHQLFPRIYDTKFLSYILRKFLEAEGKRCTYQLIEITAMKMLWYAY